MEKKQNSKKNLPYLQSELCNSYLKSNLYDGETSLNKFINDLERDIIRQTLLVCNGNKKNASLLLGIKYSTLIDKVKKYQIHIQKKYYFYETLES